MEGLVSGIAGGGVVGLITVIAFVTGIFIFKRVLAERDRLLEKQTADTQARIEFTACKLERHIIDEQPARLVHKLDALETKVEKHLQEDNPGVVANEFKHVNGTLEKLCAKMDHLSDDVVQLKTSAGENEKFTRSLHTSIKELRLEVKNGH